MLPLSHIAPVPHRGGPRWIARAGAALLLAAGGCGGGEGGAGARGLLSRAEALAADEQAVEAARLIEAGLESLPAEAHGEARLAMARHFHRAGLAGSALEAAEAALAAGVTTPEALYLRGDSLRQLERFEEAGRALEKLLAAHPAHHLGKLALGAVRYRAADPAAALPLFEDYFKAASPGEPEHAGALLEHGRALRSAGRHREAANRFFLLLEKDPLEGLYYSELAASYYRLRLRSQARFIEEIYKTISRSAFEEHVERGLGRSGAAAFALAQRAANRLRQRRFLDAFQSYRKAARLDASYPLIRIFYAELCLRFRRFQEARETVAEGIRLGARPASGLHWMEARGRIEEGDLAGARAAIERAAGEREREGTVSGGGAERAQMPTFSLHLIRSRLALEAGDLAAAEEAAGRAEAEVPGGWEPRYWRGRARLERGDAASALALFAEAAERGGGSFPDLLLWKALALERGGRPNEAREAIETLLRSQPGLLAAREAHLRLVEDSPAAHASREALSEVKRLRSRVVEAERGLAGLPLEASGEAHLELGKLHLALREPIAFDHLFLAADLLPRNGEVLKLLLSGMRQPQDVFVRIHLLRRLLAIDPREPEALGELAEQYLRFQARLDEAEKLAAGLHAQGPRAASFRLLGLAALLRGKRDEALAILEGGLKAFPGDPPLLEALGRVLEMDRPSRPLDPGASLDTPPLQR